MDSPQADVAGIAALREIKAEADVVADLQHDRAIVLARSWKTQVSTELSDILLRLNRLAVEAVDRRLPDLNELISAAWTRTYDVREAVDPS